MLKTTLNYIKTTFCAVLSYLLRLGYRFCSHLPLAPPSPLWFNSRYPQQFLFQTKPTNSLQFSLQKVAEIEMKVIRFKAKKTQKKKAASPSPDYLHREHRNRHQHLIEATGLGVEDTCKDKLQDFPVKVTDINIQVYKYLQVVRWLFMLFIFACLVKQVS